MVDAAAQQVGLIRISIIEFTESKVSNGMNHDQHSLSQKLPMEIDVPLRELRNGIRRYVLLQGLAFSLLFGLSAFWFFGWCDFYPIRIGASESPRIARIIMLSILGVGFAYLFLRFGILKWLVSWPNSTLALLLERCFPELQSRVSTTVMLLQGTKEGEPQADLAQLRLAMQQETIEQASRAIQKIDVQRVLRWSPLYWQLAFLGLVVVMSLVGGVWQREWTAHWISRFFGLSDQPWPRAVSLTVEGIELDIPSFSGETDRKRFLLPFSGQRISVGKGRGGVLRVSADRNAKQVPEYCTVTYVTQDGARGRANMRRVVDAQESSRLPFVLEGPPFESIDQQLSFSVAAEDLKLTGYSIQTVDSPVVAGMALALTYPSYLQKNSTTGFLPETVEYRNGVRLPQGTQVLMQGLANQALDRVEYRIAESGQYDDESEVHVVPCEGNSFSITLPPLNQNLLIELRLWGRNGLCADRILQYVLNVVPDSPPSIELALQGIGSAITPVAILPLEARISDDHGTRTMWTEWILNESTPLRLPVSAKADRPELVSGSYDMKEMADRRQLSPAVGMTLAMTLAAVDHYDLDSNPHVGRASPIQLAIVSPDALLLMLEKRELAMRGRIELIITEMTQMRDLLTRIQTNFAKPTPAAPTDPTSSDNPDNPNQDPDSSEESEERMVQVRIQQSMVQTGKSETELRGVAQEVQKIAAEIANNRIDNKDRQERLQTKVYQPIQEILEKPFPELEGLLKVLDQAAMRERVEEKGITEAVAISNRILAQLDEILTNMIDMQDFNELIDMVRGLTEDQAKLLEETKSEQKKQVLDLFK